MIDWKAAILLMMDSGIELHARNTQEVLEFAIAADELGIPHRHIDPGKLEARIRQIGATGGFYFYRSDTRPPMIASRKFPHGDAVNPDDPDFPRSLFRIRLPEKH